MFFLKDGAPYQVVRTSGLNRWTVFFKVEGVEEQLLVAGSGNEDEEEEDDPIGADTPSVRSVTLCVVATWSTGSFHIEEKS